MQNNPGYFCKGCKDRTVEPNCHMTCEKYLDQIKLYEQKKAVRAEIREKEFIVRNFKKERVEATLKKMGRYK